MNADLEVLYRDCWAVAADSVARLRRCDVDRVLDMAFRFDALDTVKDRLRKDRPELAGTIDSYEVPE